MSTHGLKLLLWVLLALGVQDDMFAQITTPSPWQASINPVAIYQLDRPLLDKFLDQTFSRWNAADHSKGIPVDLPLPDGSKRSYLVWQSEQMASKLVEKYADIKTYFGQDLENPRRTVYLISSALGVKVLYFNHAGLQYSLEPLPGQLPLYQFVLPQKNAQLSQLIQACSAEMHEEELRFGEVQAAEGRRGETKLYRYRLALACTGEYGSYHGTSKEEVLIAMNELLLRVNAIFERELSIHFDLVADNDELIFLDPATDPYNNEDVEDLLEANKMVCNYAIGYPNFDLGHVLSTTFGGQAHIGSVCNFSRKAKAFSGLQEPEGYYMSAVFAHELAHQLGAQHTQSNDCNRNLPTAYEPGSGSTIMAYAGICAPNIQDLPDDYFHGNSLDLIGTKAAQGLIFGCVPGVKTENLPPEADAGSDLYIPIGTPFRLTGKGSDANGDSLTYLWEQMDAALPEDSLHRYGPIFRSVPPSVSPMRMIGGTADAWEALPLHERKATFRLTVKDIRMGLGSVAYDEMTVHFIDTLGPLRVLSPDSESNPWAVEEEQLISWDVAGTDQHPINCDTISILLSNDGGQSFDLLLAENIPNSGSIQINAPDITGSDFKIKVQCKDTPIFAVSEGLFTIYNPDAPTPTDTIPDIPIDTVPDAPMDTIPNIPIDTVLDAPMDTIPDMPIDTLPDAPMDTIPDIPIDTLPDAPMDTIPDMPIDTMPNVPMDTIPDMPIDTVPDAPMDTIPDIPIDTVPDAPMDTIPDIPIDTVPDTPMDTIPDMPIDTVPDTPMDTIPDMPIDTVPDTPMDTIPDMPIDTVPDTPMDTVVIHNPPDQQDTGDPASACPYCPPIVEIAPNPTSGMISWKANIRNPASGDLQFLDGTGRLLEARKLRLEPGLTIIRWDLSYYPAGTYWLRWLAEGQIVTRPVIVKH